MHFLYTDQPNTFNCQVEIQGADKSQSQARLVVETKEGVNLLFKGKLSSNGNCEVPLEGLKNFLKESEHGNLKLEIIVEDNIFVPWESEYIVKTSKKVKVTEVKSNEEVVEKTPKINVVITTPSNIEYHLDQLDTLLESVKGSTKNLNKEKIFDFYKRKQLTNEDPVIINEIKNKFI
jgi:hypothetical protein